MRQLFRRRRVTLDVRNPEATSDPKMLPLRESLSTQWRRENMCTIYAQPTACHVLQSVSTSRHAIASIWKANVEISSSSTTRPYGAFSAC